MKKLYIFILFIFILVSCSKTILKTGAISEQNKINISSLKIGMTKNQVLDIMGHPHRTQQKAYQSEIYEIWYYITEPTFLGQTKLITKNLTPLIFEGRYLKGWGRNFYKFTFDIENEKWKRKLEKQQQYTNDEEEWPRNEHKVISPMNEPNAESSEQKRREERNKEILEMEPISPPNEVDDQIKKSLKQKNKSIDPRCKKTKDENDNYIFWE